MRDVLKCFLYSFNPEKEIKAAAEKSSQSFLNQIELLFTLQSRVVWRTGEAQVSSGNWGQNNRLMMNDRRKLRADFLKEDLGNFSLKPWLRQHSSPNPTWPHLIPPDPTWSHLTSPDPTWPHLIPPDLTWPHLTSPDPTWPHLTPPDLTWPHMTPPDLTWPHLTSHDPTWPHLTPTDPTWPHLIPPDLTWQVRHKEKRRWCHTLGYELDEVKYLKIGKRIKSAVNSDQWRPAADQSQSDQIKYNCFTLTLFKDVSLCEWVNVSVRSWSVSAVVWVTQRRKLLLHLLQSRWGEESGVSSMFPLLQVNGFKSDKIAGLLVDFLPNRVGVFPLSLLCFLSKLKQETGGGRTHRLLQPRVTPIKLTTKKSCSLFLHRLPAWWWLRSVPAWLQICWCQRTALICVNKCYLNHRGHAKSLNSDSFCFCVTLQSVQHPAVRSIAASYTTQELIIVHFLVSSL